MKDLTTDEVNDRLMSYTSEATTNELYEFGKVLVDESTERVNRLDAKATTIAGYAGTIIALLLATFNVWKPSLKHWALGLVFLGALSNLIAATVALHALSPKTYDWFSDDEWFQKVYLDQPDTLRRYHVLTMHNVVRSHDETNKVKSRSIKVSQWLLGFGAILFLIALADATGKAL